MPTPTSNRAPAAPRRQGRPRVLSREMIIACALDHDLATVTLSTIARELGVTHAALYRYMKTADDLRLACVREIADRMPWPADEGDWDQRLRALSQHLHEACLAHPGLAASLCLCPDASAATGHQMERFRGQLLGTGLTPPQADLAIDAVGDVVLGAHLQHALHGTPAGVRADNTAEKVELVLAGLRVRLDLP